MEGVGVGLAIAKAISTVRVRISVKVGHLMVTVDTGGLEKTLEKAGPLMEMVGITAPGRILGKVGSETRREICMELVSGLVKVFSATHKGVFTELVTISERGCSTMRINELSRKYRNFCGGN